MDEFLRWLHVSDPSPEDREAIVQDLLIASQSEDDGFAVACRLKDERDWFGVDREMMELCDVLLGTVDDVAAERVRAWARDANPPQNFQRGDRVEYISLREWHEAEIESIHSDRAQYCIHVPALGHVKTGSGILGLIVNWEDEPERFRRKEVQ